MIFSFLLWILGIMFLENYEGDREAFSVIMFFVGAVETICEILLVIYFLGGFK